MGCRYYGNKYKSLCVVSVCDVCDVSFPTSSVHSLLPWFLSSLLSLLFLFLLFISSGLQSKPHVFSPTVADLCECENIYHNWLVCFFIILSVCLTLSVLVSVFQQRFSRVCWRSSLRPSTSTPTSHDFESPLETRRRESGLCVTLCRHEPASVEQLSFMCVVSEKKTCFLQEFLLIKVWSESYCLSCCNIKITNRSELKFSGNLHTSNQKNFL